MGSVERRQQIVDLLYIRTHMTMSELAKKFGVTYRTIQRDIDILSLNYPITVYQGRGGGIYIEPRQKVKKPPITDEDLKVLVKLRDHADKQICHLNSGEREILHKILIWLQSDCNLLKESEKYR